MNADRLGLGWRPALAAGILGNLDRIDLVEVMADDYFEVAAHERRALRQLGLQVPITLHGTKLGLASTIAAEPRWLDAMARVAEAAAPLYWSEHLAFVRGGGHEIGHLAAPPRTAATIDGLARNVARARAVVGTAPMVENVATLIDPPASTMTETAWITGCLAASGSALLLDLHNLYCNAVNFGLDPLAMLDALPLEHVHAVHIAGGKRLPAGRWLDDHLHAVPDPVFRLLEALAARVARPLDVILERDGAYPPITDLLAEVDRARAAVAAGRQALLRRERAA